MRQTQPTNGAGITRTRAKAAQRFVGFRTGGRRALLSQRLTGSVITREWTQIGLSRSQGVQEVRQMIAIHQVRNHLITNHLIPSEAP